MRELKIIYRSESHAPFWVLAEQAGIWEKNGLRVNTSPELGRERAVEALKNGHVDLISGNHHNLYARRAKTTRILFTWPSSATVGRKTA